MDESKDRQPEQRGVDPHPDANRDPITGEAGSHPVGTGVGSAGGAAAGAAAGAAVGGPAGALVGGAIGAVAGGAAGHVAGEALDPTVEARYWRDNYHRRPYYEPGSDYSAYEPAYRYGWESANDPTYRDLGFDDAEPRLASGWSNRSSDRPWDRSREAVRDAWDRARRRR
jgi:hypothetical protein